LPARAPLTWRSSMTGSRQEVWRRHSTAPSPAPAKERIVLDHVGIEVSDYDRSKIFYELALKPLGMELLMEPMPVACGFGLPGDGKPFFWITARGKPAASGVHVAFTAPSRDVVDAFHEAALAAGAQDNGGPGEREIYHPHYYGAFVLDPDGNNVEAVCHKPA